MAYVLADDGKLCVDFCEKQGDAKHRAPRARGLLPVYLVRGTPGKSQRAWCVDCLSLGVSVRSLAPARVYHSVGSVVLIGMSHAFASD